MLQVGRHGGMVDGFFKDHLVCGGVGEPGFVHVRAGQGDVEEVLCEDFAGGAAGIFCDYESKGIQVFAWLVYYARHFRCLDG